MQSNNPHATHFLLRRNLFIGVIVFVLVFFALPFWGLSHIPAEKEAIFTRKLNMEDFERSLTELVSSNLMCEPFNLEINTLLYCGLGFLCAMILMRHLFSRRQGLMHAALPDKRESDFLRRCTGYAVLGLLPIVLNQLLYVLIVAGNGLLSYVAWSRLLGTFGIMLLLNLYGFAIGMLASVLTGTFWAAPLAGGVLFVGAEVLAELWRYLAYRYLHTLVSTGFNHMLQTVSPALSLYKGLYRPASFVWVPGVAAILVALLVSFLLYRVRKTEAAEHTLAFDCLHTIMGFLLPLLGGSLMGIILLMSFETELSLIVGMVLGTALTFWVCRMLFTQRLCGIGKQWYLPAAAVVLLLMGVGLLHTDLMGFDHYLPERGELTAISYQASGTDGAEAVTLTSPDALDAAYEWCTLMRDEVDGLETGVNASECMNSGCSIEVSYQLGKRTVHRCYPNNLARAEAQPCLKRMMESDDYRQSLIQAWHLDAGDIIGLSMYGVSGGVRNDEMYEQFGIVPDYLYLSREKDGKTIDQWTGALREDILSRTFEQKQQDPIMNLQLNIDHPEDDVYLYVSIPILPTDTHFLKAVLGARADAFVSYVTGGFAASEDVVVIKTTLSATRDELAQWGMDERDAATSVVPASTPEEAVRWVRNARVIAGEHYYMQPRPENESHSWLYIYRLSDIGRYQGVYDFKVPEDRTQLFYQRQIPYTAVFEVIDQ